MKEVSRDSPPSSDDEEEDRRNLIPENDHAEPRRLRSSDLHAFDIDEKLGSSGGRCFPGFNFRNLRRKKRYLLMAFIPLLVVFLYFSLDLRSLVKNSSVWDVKYIGSPEDFGRMRESELRALHLLKEQQLGLVNLLKSIGSNHTVHIDSNNNGSDSSKFQEIKAKIYDQISMNNQVQKVLLSTHKLGDVNVSAVDGEFGDLTFSGFNFCGKKNTGLSGRRTIEWIPKPHKYLFAICASGQTSNHLICLEKHMFFAALLKRVLIIPSSKVDYEFNRILDIEHINKCVGRKVVVTFDEFSELKKRNMRINKFICYFPSCFIDDDHLKKLKSLGLSLPKLESPWTDDVKNPKERTAHDVETNFSSDDDVIAMGDVYFADVDRDWVMQPGGPIAHKCKTLIEPNRLIMLTAQRNAKNPSCFYSVPQAANCIKRVVERANSPVIYLSTDAAESETGLLQSLIVVDGMLVPHVKRPARNSAEKWDALLYRHGYGDDTQVEAMLDKAICALSSVFIGSSGSTFTDDIMRLRKDWGSASTCDEYICQGNLPDFIADDE
ncbi:hypothetical protein V2J09_004573 [Rumex salicifolius]